MAFQFRTFTIDDSACGMKVGQDSVLLGAWLNATGHRRALDVGTGSGVLALLLAQRGVGQVTGVEIEPAAARQAARNVERSLYANGVGIVQEDIRHFTAAPFDLIVSNPPYYDTAPPGPHDARAQARQTGTLAHCELLAVVLRLLAPEGTFAVVLPAAVAHDFSYNAWLADLYLQRRCDVTTRPGCPPSRSLMEFTRREQRPQYSKLLIGSPEQRTLTAGMLALQGEQSI